MARTAPTECFFSEVEMATTEFADIGIYRMRWSGVGWGRHNRRILTFQHHLIHFSTLQMDTQPQHPKYNTERQRPWLIGKNRPD